MYFEVAGPAATTETILAAAAAGVRGGDGLWEAHQRRRTARSLDVG